MQQLSLGSDEMNWEISKISEFLPSTITHLFVGPYWSHYFTNFPPSLIHLFHHFKYDRNIPSLLSLYSSPSLRVLQISGTKFNYPLDSLPQNLLELNLENTQNNFSLESLPPSLTKLSLGFKFNQKLENLPLSLKILKLGPNFNQPISSLPPALTRIKFFREFDQKIDEILPRSLLSITFRYDSKFNQKIDHLPPSLKKLTLGLSFNQKINHLPFSLQKLSIYGQFNQPIISLPHSLKKLIIRGDFDQPVNFLPPSLSHLSLSHSFPVDSLPLSITHLSLTSHNFRHSLDGLPLSLSHFFIHSYDKPISNLPNSIKQIVIFGNFNEKIILPSSLTHFLITDAANFYRPQTLQNEIIILPQNIKYLHLSASTYKLEIDNLPPSLSHISFSRFFNSPVNHLPHSLTHIKFGNNFNQRIDHLPLSLSHLYLGFNFNQPVDKLPKNLIFLIIDGEFNQTIDFLPLSLTHLYLNCLFNKKIKKFPPSLQHFMCIGNQFNQKLPKKFPPLLKTIRLGSYNKEINFKKLPEFFYSFSVESNYKIPKQFTNKFKIMTGRSKYNNVPKLFANSPSLYIGAKWEVPEQLFLETHCIPLRCTL